MNGGALTFGFPTDINLNQDTSLTVSIKLHRVCFRRRRRTQMPGVCGTNEGHNELQWICPWVISFALFRVLPDNIKGGINFLFGHGRCANCHV